MTVGILALFFTIIVSLLLLSFVLLTNLHFSFLFSINVQNRRVGGAYGSKLSRCAQIAVACALAAFILRKPVRMMLPIETNMQAIGKRAPCLSTYEVKLNTYP